MTAAEASWRNFSRVCLGSRKSRQCFTIGIGTIIAVMLINAVLLHSATDSTRILQKWSPSFWSPDSQTTQGPPIDIDDARLKDIAKRMHILIPSSQTNPNLCKNILTQTILGYPQPVITAWNTSYHDDRLLGKGSHLAKITSVLAWLNNHERAGQADFEEEFVIMTDAYDVWWQLPPETLVSRYYQVLARERDRMTQQLGRAARIEELDPQVIWAASKRCGPNQIQSLACYPIPQSPLPEDIFGPQTDHFVGDNAWKNMRQRYLVSGFVMGPVANVRRVFQRANEKLEECLARGDQEAKFDSGRRGTSLCHKGSDQSLFVEMMGEQEFHREVMRRHHRNWMDAFLDRVIANRPGAPPGPSALEHAVVDDPLNPSFRHENANPTYLPNKPFEYGMTVDYASDLIHQTSNALRNTAYIVHADPQHRSKLKPNVDNFQCSPKTPMPLDLPSSGGIFELFSQAASIDTDGHNNHNKIPTSWDQLPLYSEVCIGRIPVMIHHNWVAKWPREKLWRNNWWHGQARNLLEAKRRQGDRAVIGGAATDAGVSLTWEELCPSGFEKDIF